MNTLRCTRPHRRPAGFAIAIGLALFAISVALVAATQGTTSAAQPRRAASGAAEWEAWSVRGDVRSADAMAVNADGEVFVAGEPAAESAPELTALVAKYSPGSALKWTTRIRRLCCGIALVADNQGGVVAGGVTPLHGDLTTTRALVFRVGADGNVAWRRRPAGDRESDLRAVAMTADGGVLAAGFLASRHNWANDQEATPPWFLAKYSAGGIRQWVRRFDNSEWTHVPESIGVSARGDILVAGIAYTLGWQPMPFPNGRSAAFVARLDASGSRRWLRRFDARALGDPGGRDVIVTGIAIAPNGAAYITGSVGQYQDGGPEWSMVDAFAARVSSVGTLLWSRRTGGDMLDSASGVAFTNGLAWIAGWDREPAGGDSRSKLLLEAFAPDGGTRDVSHEGLPRGVAEAVATGPDGSPYLLLTRGLGAFVAHSTPVPDTAPPVR